MKKYLFYTFFFTTLISCNSESGMDEQNFGSLTLKFNNKVATEDLVLLTQSYSNTHGEVYTIDELKYIISNISLHQDNGKTFTVPVEESYFVIDESNELSINLRDIPVGLYTEVTFGFGIDPTSYPIESGTLNFVPTAEEAGMLWTWSAGYKFLKFEGNYSSATNATEVSSFVYHVGSHGATLDNYKEITLAFVKSITQDSTEDLAINFDVSKIFDSTYSLSLAEKDDIQVDPENAPKIAENVRTAFSIE
ncbi:MbnP family protein [Dokdonia sp. Hel_I_53]|uniref:MbnP family protein n=1 Tax=Dokdonia sp. Hel_I_53 TaxID=1566287 RepID=UPI00119C2B02|nr:MbnP family protein [Dokdonia sp. Hel_I_53]TVZ52321.1 hypothetical protein OD90_1494 [Dokdonia sp. Hel_I_53]